MTKYTIKTTNQFKKDFKLAQKRHLNTELLKDIVNKLANGIALDEKNKDHALSGNWSGHRECHILPCQAFRLRLACTLPWEDQRETPCHIP